MAVLSVGGLAGTENDTIDAIKLVASSCERMQFMQNWIKDVGMDYECLSRFELVV